MDEIRQFRKDLLAKVTRMEAMEEKFGIQISHLSLITEPDSEYVQINFEVTPLTGSSITQDVDINFAFYDDEGTITLKSSIWIDSDKFRGFSIESSTFNINTKAYNISRIICYLSES